jgi:type IV pilus biogenesis protein CpaD/CtpE
MKRILILAAVAASIAACHSQNEDQTGAAPARDTTTTHAIDTTRTGPPGEAGRPGNATITRDSVLSDSTQIRDTTSQAAPQAPPQDTLGPRNSGQSDTTQQGGATEMHPDSSSNR